MEKEQILSTLTGKLGNTSFSEKSLQTYVENNLPAEGTEPDEAYWAKHVAVLNSFQGQFNHDVATKVTEQANLKFEEYKRNWSPGNDGKPNDVNPDVESLKKQIEELTKRIDDSQSRVTQSELMAKVKESMRSQNATDSYVLEKALQGKTLDATKSIEELTKLMLSEYDKEYKACRGEGAAPRVGEAGGAPGKSKTDLRFEAKKRRQQAAK